MSPVRSPDNEDNNRTVQHDANSNASIDDQQTFEFSGVDFAKLAETVAPHDDDSVLDPSQIAANAETFFPGSEATQIIDGGQQAKQIGAVDRDKRRGTVADKTKVSSKISSAADSKVAPTSVGSIIGNYEVISVLGRGGMGIVYKARHRTLNRIVALKMILHGLHGGTLAIQRFLAEAKAVAALQHPGIVQIFEISENEGLPYFSLEFVEGEDLHSSLKGQPWSSKPAAELIASLCDAMQYAHDHQILHRDIKPANILLDSNKRPKLTDFGLAKKLDTSDQVTKDGTVMGTPSYMPPEQARGDAGAINACSDIYSLGAVLYQLLTGRAPFVSDSMMDTLVQVIHRDPIQPRELQPGVPIDLETICVKALQKEPQNRYQSCSEMAEDLRRYVRGEPILARPISHWERLVRWCKRNPKIAFPTAVASFFVIATAAVSLYAWQTTAAQAIAIASERDDAQDARKKAEDQRAEAEKQKAEADKQRTLALQQQVLAEENSELAIKQANLALQTIQFILTDTDTKLMQQPGSSDIRIAVMEAISKKWDELDIGMTGGVRGTAVPTFMSVRQRIASTLASLDRIKEANEEYKKLEVMGRERVVVKGGTDASRMNLAKILMTSSSIQRQADNPAGTEKMLSEARDIMLDVIKNPKPESPTDMNHVQQVLAAINQNLGVEYLRQGRVADTASVFQEAVSSNQAVLKSIESQPGYSELPLDKQDSQTLELKISIDKSVLGLAYVLMRLGRIDESQVKYDEAITSRRSELARNPKDIRLKPELAGQLSLFGRSLLWIDRLDAAAPIIQESLALSEESYKMDPEKTDLKRSYSFALYVQGVLCDMQGKKDLALSYFEKCRGMRTSLYSSSPDDKNAYSLMLAESRVGNLAAARELSDKLAAKTVPNPEIHIERACALSQLAAGTNGDEKAKLIDEALSALERSVTDGYRDPFRISHDPDLRPLQREARLILLLEKLNSFSSSTSSREIPK